jgi:hypothetical protein
MDMGDMVRASPTGANDKTAALTTDRFKVGLRADAVGWPAEGRRRCARTKGAEKRGRAGMPTWKI